MAEDKDKFAQEVRERGYDVGVTDTPGSANIISPQHSGDSGGIKEGSDLSKSTKITLGRYLSSATSKNYIPVVDVSKDDISLTTTSGKPSALDQNPNSGKRFSTPLPSTSDAFSTPDAGSSSSGKSLKDTLSKGRQDKNAEFDGNTLLTTGVAAVKDRYTSAVIKSNRFSAKQTFTPNPRDASDSPRDLAYYSRKSIDETRVQAVPGTKSISHDQMRKIGQVLMLRATGELDSSSRNFDPEANVGALLPGSNQILPAQVINSRDLEARNVLESMINEEVGSKTPGPDNKSWGSLNNHLEPFTGILPAGMVALCVALILAVRVSFELLGTLLSLVTDKPKYPYNSVGIYFKGKYRSEQPDGDDKGIFGGVSIGGIKDLNTLLGLRDTSYKYDDCFKKGMDIFFGTQGSSDQSLFAKVASSVGASFKLALQSPGYYVVFCRSIIRSGYGIGKKLADLGSNPLSIAQGILNVIDDLRSSKIIAAYNMFAQIGDTALRDEANKSTYLNQDALPDNVPVVAKSRYAGSRTLAWRAAAAPSLYVLPQAYINATTLANKTDAVKRIGPLWDPATNFIGSADDKFGRTANVYQTETLKSRIPSNIVKAFENRLEAEHVPFYFQDMRTNEIVSFHAFLTSLSEDYTPNWEGSDAYGRVDQIRIYKNTGRRVNLSFRIVALDPADFESMWFKINKLVTLVYPQWNRGKRLVTPDGKLEFSQPFSQLISASPIIRLRVGDLIRSNYSKFSLVRMFDVTKPNEVATKISLKDKIGEISNAIHRVWSGKGEQKDFDTIKSAIANKTIKARVMQNAAAIMNPPTDSAGLAGAASALAGAASSALSAATGIGGAAGKKDNPIINLTSNYDISEVVAMNGKMMVVKLGAPEPASATAKYGIPIGTSIVLNWASENWGQLVSGLDANITPIVDASKEFLGDSNPIVKYFEDNTFRGLACTIDSMNFSWLDENLWEVAEPGSRAPKSCIVTLSLTPIHDIAPGIDSFGFNRAPVYRVGKQIAAITDPTEMDSIKRIELKPGGDSKSTESPSVLGIGIPKIP